MFICHKGTFLNSKLQNINLAINKLFATLKRFPFAMLSAYIFTIMLMTLATVGYPHRMELVHYNVANKIALISSIGFFLFTTLRLISRNYILLLLGFILIITYYIYLPNNIHNLHKLEMEFPFIIFSLISLMITAPYLNHSSSNIKFWSWAKHIILSLLLSFIFGVILFAGLSGGLYITEKLFDLGQTQRYIEHISIFTMGIFGTYFFLSQLPKYPRLLPLKAYNNMEIIFTKFILTPLFALYFIILYTYTAKIIFVGEWPKGTVSISILLFSAFSILTYLFWTPLWNKRSEKYKNFFWWTILFQTFVLAIALYLRVEPYGWTANRYMIGVLGFWLFALSIYFIFNKKASYRTIFISLPIILMLSLFSPFSATITAKHSQQEKLKTLLAKLDVDENISKDSNLSLQYNISSAISYLYNHHGMDSLFPIIPKVVTEYQNREQNTDSKDCTPMVYSSFPSYATKQLGFNHIDRWQWEQNQAIKRDKFKTLELEDIPKNFTVMSERDSFKSINIKGYDWLLDFRYFIKDNNYPRYCLPPQEKKAGAKIKYIIETTKDTIIVKESNRTLATIDIKAFIDKIITTEKKDKSNDFKPYYEPIRFTKDELTYLFRDNQVNIKLIFSNIMVSKKNKLLNYRGDILIGKKL